MIDEDVVVVMRRRRAAASLVRTMGKARAASPGCGAQDRGSARPLRPLTARLRLDPVPLPKIECVLPELEHTYAALGVGCVRASLAPGSVCA